MIEMRRFTQVEREGDPNFLRADGIATELLAHLNEPATLAAIELADLPGRSSAVIQATFLDRASALGFRNEAAGLFASYETSALRPDYYLPLDGSGILLEVERGKTTINNMDLLDFWKCHLCEHANYLFLLVPKKLKQNENMSPRNEFASVSKRLATFFRPRNYTNVYGLWLFGY